MISKKCFVSLLTFSLTLLVCFASMHFMQLFTVSKYTGVITGLVISILTFILLLNFKKYKFYNHLVIFTNAIASGLAISSLFVYLGAFPRISHTAILFAVLVALFYLYNLFCNLSFLKKHYILCIIIFCVLIIVGILTGFILTNSLISILSCLCVIPFISFLSTIITPAKNKTHHMKNIAFCSFSALIIVSIVVLVIISQGEGLDGLMGETISFDNAKQLKDPYSYKNTKMN